ncbi:MAG TPA: hypothetical protein VHB99_07625 [Pirellulales bacterium]|nr:hypothetical protein [Pirellulales bacterium]
MRTVSIELDDAKYEALDALAKKCGLSAPAELVARQIDAVLAAEPGKAVGAALLEHLRTVIEEDRNLLERLAK